MFLPSPLQFESLVNRRETVPIPLRVGLSLTDDVVVEPLLALIPFFSVGITGFATFTISFLMSRISIIPLYLYVAVLVAFIAALLDLSQLLIRGSQNVQLGIGLDAVSGFLDAREIFFALSFGFRFIFFWAIVAEGFGWVAGMNTSHLASWNRWGFVGFGLKFITLAACFAIPALQVVWRLGPSDSPSFIVVYVAESTMGIVISALFILKILLTLFVCPTNQRSSALIHYSLPAISLLLSASIGIGNLMSMSFSETTLGRFLQAMEMYLLLLLVLALAFQAKPKPRPRSSFQALARPFSVGQPFSEKPQNPSSVIPPTNPSSSKSEKRTLTSNRTSLDRRSSLISPRAAPPLPGPSFRNDPELGYFSRKDDLPTSDIAEIPRNPAIGPPPPRPPPMPAAGFLPIPKIPSPQVSPVIDISLAPSDLPWNIPEVTPPSPSESGTKTIRRYSDLPRFSGIRFERESNASSLTPPTFDPGFREDSPIYGLDGIIRQLPAPQRQDKRSSTKSRASRSSYPSRHSMPLRASTSSFDQLLKEQQALDNSIRLLKLFSPRDTASTSSQYPEPSLPQALISTPTPSEKMPSLLGSLSPARFESVSARSEFSLSNFPEPPEPEAPVESDSRTRRVVATPMSPNEERFSADVTAELENRSHERYSSEGTRFEITSFIDGLTTPRDEQGPSATREEEAENKRASNLRPLLLNASSTASNIRSGQYHMWGVGSH